jgi:phospholipid/cholesterol/gamma-HCH transport system substrate-binding protein
MKQPTDRRLAVIGLTGALVTAAIVVGALEYDRLPIFTAQKSEYSAYFAESSGLDAGARVQVSGLQVGEVESVTLDGARVLIKFNVDQDVHLGDRTEAAIKAKSLLGAKLLELTPRGEGRLADPIPTDRTTPAYQLPDALGDLTATVKDLDTDQLNRSLATLAETFRDVPPQLRSAVDGVARISQTLNERDTELRRLLSGANDVSGVLSERTDQIVGLIVDTNVLLVQLQTQSQALDQISGDISVLAKQLSGFIADNRTTLRPALDKLNGVAAIIDNRKQQVQESIKLLNVYVMSLGETVSGGPFFKAYVANLLPGQFIQPFVDAAFSDLGLDPNVLLPSERTDPAVGQVATPPLPIPMPRTGQGGPPALTLPDAITGNVGDPRYPYREPPPAPEPGGPPPGPPAPEGP